MENNHSTLRSMFTLGDCGAAIGRQCSRICGSSRSYRDDPEAYIPGQTGPGSSSRSPDRRKYYPVPTSRSDTCGPSSRHPHLPISSQAQLYRRSYPEAQSTPSLNPTILGPNGYAYVSPNVSTRRETAGSVANSQLDESRFGKELV
ncbi:hypothetical protein BGAL_0716g00040 [Botrytis galanthina]|uniref:Uncharacterized protein n=1 Tax=Botrytis galanthina TaxID=278940 RepID=A0A4S8QTZ1_9HELO|nr:hypothetical protein BGAL_0716g00040 [Botrytis galanthina]